MALQLFFAAALPFSAGDGSLPEVGAKAPDFTLVDQDGRYVTRDSLLGKKAVLAFYPKDFTGG
mgnify:CR=1 FL=1